ncbi:MULTISPECIES: tyrosine-protein phosphatase [unclassified Paenibacillus]|uniref:tyrosine-protein phosphatase n=1 Tax=unclassified Paenibacillus TaxID=185978 RepID=UPI0009553A16|nr:MULTISPECIES: tyrosine-protein phosphatase [unclassified Paenibacillus]ASS67484.1 tyrosine-protein phosphatase [Paenibacillus sp. RUD330]SIQ75431.1 protein-tyrosine phosphatase [Paenibacillus sp. RU4X]SIQ96859.1 protein-tyrosine phosphatase [Paenibacillus sp. RU4T]
MKEQLETRLNMRELGGCMAADGRRVKEGVLFRSGELHGLTAEEALYVESLGLTAVCDLRTEEKSASKPAPQLKGVRHVSLPVIGGEFSMSEMPRLLQQWKEEGGQGSPIQEIYRRFVTESQSLAAYRGLLQALLRAEGRPVLWNCTLGKDRTGFAAAVVLLALGVPEADIAADYMRTGANRREANEAILRQAAAFLSDESHLELVRSVLAVREEYIQAAFDEIRRVHGTPEAFLKEAIGLTEPQLKQLREWYLEPAAC